MFVEDEPHKEGALLVEPEARLGEHLHLQRVLEGLEDLQGN